MTLQENRAPCIPQDRAAEKLVRTGGDSRLSYPVGHHCTVTSFPPGASAEAAGREERTEAGELDGPATHERGKWAELLAP